MDVTLLKVLLLLIMGVVPVVFGLLPIKVCLAYVQKFGKGVRTKLQKLA